MPSKAGAAWALAGTLEAGGNVGMLVDQKFKRGSRPPSSAVLPHQSARPQACRKFDCDIHPARASGCRTAVIDWSGARLDLARGPTAAIDVAASCQQLNDVVERWVREHPDQWMWFHPPLADVSDTPNRTFDPLP